jgi:hypothetical protein
MKLTVATSILATQTLPVVSEESQFSTEDRSDIAEVLLALQNEPFFTTEKKKKHPRAQRTGTKDRIDALFLHHDRRHRSGNNLLVNSVEGNTLCDPASLDADIGMLSCGLGYECIVDETSTMGGVCTPSISRQLQENDVCFLCPVPFTLAQKNYDIVIEDTESGYGGKTCESIIDPAYYSLSLDTSTCAAVASAVRAAGCCAPRCQLCDRGSFVPAYSDTVVDGISIPGYDEYITCGFLYMAASIKGIIDLDDCPASRQAAIEAGCCEPFECLTCDVGSYISSDATESCSTQLLYYNTTLSEEDCVDATQLAEEEGCCTVRPIQNVCDVCGDATFYPQNNVFSWGTCDYAQSVASADFCATYTYALAPFCCGKAALPANDTEAPVPTPDESTGKPATDAAPTSPPSASAAMWSAGPVVVSIMCFATSTVSVGAWWLLELN